MAKVAQCQGKMDLSRYVYASNEMGMESAGGITMHIMICLMWLCICTPNNEPSLP